MVEEKRRDKRVKEDFGILCKIYERTELEGNLSKIIDISKCGLCFIANSKLGPQHIIGFSFRVPPDFKEKIEIFGRVIQSQPISDQEFKTRVAFIDISTETKNILDKIIDLGNFPGVIKK